MSDPTSLAFQASCIRDCLPLARTSDIASGLSGAIRTIEWVERNADLIKEFVRMVKESPVFLEVLREFPGSTVVDVRTIPPNRPGSLSWRPDVPDDGGQVSQEADDS